jgi:hypothetical protein
MSMRWDSAALRHDSQIVVLANFEVHGAGPAILKNHRNALLDVSWTAEEQSSFGRNELQLFFDYKADPMR